MPLWTLPAVGLALATGDAPNAAEKPLQPTPKDARVALTERSDSRDSKACEGCGGKVLPRPAPAPKPLPDFPPPAHAIRYPVDVERIRTVSAKPIDDLVEIPTTGAQTTTSGVAKNNSLTPAQPAMQQPQGEPNRRQSWWKRLNPFARRSRPNNPQREQQQEQQQASQQPAPNAGKPDNQAARRAPSQPTMLPKVTAAPLPPPPVTAPATEKVPSVAPRPAVPAPKPAPAAPKSGLVDIPTDGGELILPPAGGQSGVQQMSHTTAADKPAAKSSKRATIVRDVSAWTYTKPE
jgi:hypothetical protein